MQRLLDEGIETRRGIPCAHREPAYEREPWRARRLLETERAAERCLMLPLHSGMTPSDVERVVDALRSACA
jgi:dTDP-4-amino-4,6-dideoxygalactose transaminase